MDEVPYCDPINPNAKLCQDRAWLLGFINGCPHIAIAVLSVVPSTRTDV